MAARVPPDDVLTELGRVTYAAILLEDLTAAMCDAIRPTNPREDHRFVGRKIDDALTDLRRWPESYDRDRIDAWLTTARSAIRERNAALHAIPLVVLQRPDSETPIQFTLALGEKRMNAPYAERPLTVEALEPLRAELELASSRWREVFLLAASFNEANAPPPGNV